MTMLRATQAALAIVVLGLTVYVASWWHNHWNGSSPSQINFIFFSSVWTLLALLSIALAAARFPSAGASHSSAIILALESLTTLFWLAGFIALAVFLSDRKCFGRICAATRAVCVFGALEW
ncbi:hypothetical protein MBLNU230_g6690t2 [Neophaeotheca triangularis]